MAKDDIAGKSVLITGAGSGFGKLVAQKLAARGALITGADIQKEAVAHVMEEIREAGGQAVHVHADVVSAEDMTKVAKAAVENFGAIDVLINNAGIMPLAYFKDHERAATAWSKSIDINIKGVVHGISAVYDQMIAQGRGHVVNVSSIYGNAGIAGSGVYSATKSAVNTISDSLRNESKGKIKVTTIKPTGVMSTNLAGSVVNPEAFFGILGGNVAEFSRRIELSERNELDASYSDQDSISFGSLQPGAIADSIIWAIDQPWGVSISDVTIRASGDLFTY
ncbi:SDR family oxidoreductase [Glutamicibacter sp. Je.9.36]|uniref:SDR family oxidoreductase n=1 Tax=Glutamicibacter sp. Je.9.36 TaxID=3142837 RepID=UPI003DA8E722